MTVGKVQLQRMVQTAALLNVGELYSLERPMKQVVVALKGLLGEHAIMCNTDPSRMPELLNLEAVGWVEVADLQHQPLVGFKLRLSRWRDLCLTCNSPLEAGIKLSGLALEYWAGYPEPAASEA